MPKRFGKSAKHKSTYVAIALDTTIALVLLWLGIYHVTHEGIRSGILEIMCAISLLAAAYLVSYPWTVATNLTIGVFVFTAGIYHTTHGGWKSGVPELVFAAMLIIAAYLFRWDRKL